MEVKTVTEAFAEFLGTRGIATFNTDLYISQVPLSAPDTTYWLITSGGTPIRKLSTGETVKQYFIEVYYRSKSAKDVERNMFDLEELLNCTECVQLTGFEVQEISATAFPSDLDADDNERRIGMLQANIKIYKKEC